jgi:hypothetical protein
MRSQYRPNLQEMKSCCDGEGGRAGTERGGFCRVSVCLAVPVTVRGGERKCSNKREHFSESKGKTTREPKRRVLSYV